MVVEETDLSLKRLEERHRQLLEYQDEKRNRLKLKEEALSRKEILEKIEKWLVACQEESWLEEYNRDDNRYTAGRGAHITLKRAEKVRVLAKKISGMVETLTSKAQLGKKKED